MENQVQFAQIDLLKQEAEGIKSVAFELRSSIKNVAAWNRGVPTAGVVDNLLAVVDAWEYNHVSQLDQQVTELLEPCQV